MAGNVQNSPKGYGSKDVLVVRLDKNGKELSQLILGGKGLDEIEKMIPTKDGGALLGVYSRSVVVAASGMQEAVSKARCQKPVTISVWMITGLSS